jgi:tetratricopeptide (TPR) repeat protein
MTAAATILVLMLASVGAAPAAAPLAPPIEPSDTNGEALFRRGVAAYDAGDYKNAIALFTAAHRLSGAPEILFDIGQAFRALGDCRQAVESFDAFVAAASADDPLLPKARARRSELAPCAETTPSRPTAERAPAVNAGTIAAPKPAIPAALLSLEKRPLEAAPRSGQRTVCTISAGSTIALAAAGLGLGVAAWIKSADVEDHKVWDPEAQRDDARARAFADTSVATLVAAGVAGLVAGTSCWLAWRAEHASRPR